MTTQECNYNELFNRLNPYDSNYIDYFISLISQILLDRNKFVQSSNNDDKRIVFYNILREKIRKLNAKKIEYIGSGHSTLSFKIGDKVLKIGKGKTKRKRNLDNIPVLIPLFEDECYEIAPDEFYTLQITPYVSILDISDEDVYQTYKKLRDLGYIWNDPTLDNTGRIIEEMDYNGHHYKKGDLVIIDLEDIAYIGLEETPDYIMEEISISSYNSNVYKFETRYTKEKWPKTK